MSRTASACRTPVPDASLATRQPAMRDLSTPTGYRRHIFDGGSYLCLTARGADVVNQGVSAIRTRLATTSRPFRVRGTCPRLSAAGPRPWLLCQRRDQQCPSDSGTVLAGGRGVTLPSGRREVEAVGAGDATIWR